MRADGTGGTHGAGVGGSESLNNNAARSAEGGGEGNRASNGPMLGTGRSDVGAVDEAVAEEQHDGA